MRILIITAAWYGGGAETIAREEYQYLVSQGNECYYAYARGRVPSGIKTIKIGNDLDTYIHALYARLCDGAGFASYLATKRFIKKVEAINPDIIQIHNPECYILNIPVLFKYLKKSGRKVVWTLHDCWSFTGHCIFFDDVKCDKWKTGCGKCPGKKEYPKSVLLDRSRHNLLKKRQSISGTKNLTLVTPSIWLERIANQTYLKEFDIHVINNGIDIEKYSPIASTLREKYNIKDKIVVLGIASKWSYRKGLQYFKELVNVLDDEKYKIVLIGINDKQKKQLSNNIIVIDRTDSFEELVEWYSAADVFVNPTLADNFPTVNLEALACGTPVVTFNTGGSWESVGDLCGERVDDKSVIGLRIAIEKCVAKNISSEVCINQAKKYDRTDRYREYEQLYKDLLTQRGE